MLHRVLAEKEALMLAGALQAAVCLPLVVVDRLHAPLVLTTAAFAVEHFASGLGTTVPFAALMSATRPADARVGALAMLRNWDNAARASRS